MRPHFAVFAFSLNLVGCGGSAVQQSQTDQAANAGSLSRSPSSSVESRKLDTTLTLPAQILPYEAVTSTRRLRDLSRRSSLIAVLACMPVS